MSFKTNNSSSKHICERYNKHNCAFFNSCKTDKMRHKPVKKVIPSRKLETSSSNEVKSCSTGVINTARKLKVNKPKKITQSDIGFDLNWTVVDFCTKCGDSKANKNGSCKSFKTDTIKTRTSDVETQIFIDQERCKEKISEKKTIVHEYYKNETFNLSANEKKLKEFTLDPITEIIEDQEKAETSSQSTSETYSDSEEIGFLNPDDERNIRNIKDFRKNNYFECHSAKARVSSKGSVTSLTDHKCVYRFYLNDRLFPVPLNTDHRNSIRCMECHLPLEVDSKDEDLIRINGTIQTKVKIGNKVQDLTIMLPVKKPLIIQEKRTARDDKDDTLYFGIVKLNYNGDSIFNSTLPSDSLALKYQKGYKEYVNNPIYQYDKLKEDDIIII